MTATVFHFAKIGRLELVPFKREKIFGTRFVTQARGDALNSRDDAGTNISQSLTLKVNLRGSPVRSRPVYNLPKSR